MVFAAEPGGADFILVIDVSYLCRVECYVHGQVKHFVQFPL